MFGILDIARKVYNTELRVHTLYAYVHRVARRHMFQCQSNGATTYFSEYNTVWFTAALGSIQYQGERGSTGVKRHHIWQGGFRVLFRERGIL